MDKTMERTPTPSPDRVVSGPKALVLRQPDMAWLDIPRDQLRQTLTGSLYPGAKPESVDMVLNYCEAAGLNVMLKPVHIVPMNVKKPGTNNYEWRDVVMPGINHYRTQASRTGTYLGKTEPEFGPMAERQWGQIKLQVPEWCKITVRRLVGSHVAEFTAIEFWDENFATAGRDKNWPNQMWSRRPKGQLAKCTEAQALRMAFPELVGSETAEEMEGKTIDLEATDITPRPAATRSLDNFAGTAADAAQPADEAEDAKVEPVAADPEPEPLNDAEPEMEAEALAVWTKDKDWRPGWKWINEVMPGLTGPAKQRLVERHADLLWAVYDSDATKKRGGGPQSKAALKFAMDHKVTVPPKQEESGGQD